MIEVPEQIKEKIACRHANSPYGSIDKFLCENPDVDSFLETMVQNEPWFVKKKFALGCIAKNVLKPVYCHMCGKPLKVERVLNDTSVRFCSQKCSHSSPERLEKIRETSRRRYGCDNAMQNADIRKKLKETNLQRYGVENVFQSEESKKKIAKTNLERYGIVFCMQSSEIKEKSKATNLKKYGVAHASQSEMVKEKIKKTNLERFGAIAPAGSSQVVEKMKKTNLERYGVDCSLKNSDIDAKRQKTWQERYGGNPLATPEILEKRRSTCRKKFGSDHYFTSFQYLSGEYEKLKMRFAGKVSPMFTAEEFRGANCREEYRWRCERCGMEFISTIHTTAFDPEDEMLPRCPRCHPYAGGESEIERDILSFVESVYDGEIRHGDQRLINPLELDVYLPEKRLAIEFDGLYWHSTEAGKDSEYHLHKTEECERHGVRLIHVFEDEWRSCRAIVEDRIKSSLGIYGSRIYARDCSVVEISLDEAEAFLKRNHLQGAGRSKIRLGLCLKGELVSVMTFGKPRFNKNYDWELIRFASKLGVQVVGGASRLLSHFRRNHSGSIVSYADRRWSDGKLYEAIGFGRIGISRPNYWYVKGIRKLSRYECQKHLLPKLLKDRFDASRTEVENMASAGYSMIYDCGNLVYAMK